MGEKHPFFSPLRNVSGVGLFFSSEKHLQGLCVAFYGSGMGVFCRGAVGSYKSTRQAGRPRQRSASKNALAARFFFPPSEAGAPSLGRSVKKTVFSPSRESFFFEYLSTLWFLPPPYRPWWPPTPPLAKGSYIPRNSFHEISFRGLGASGSRGFHKYIFHGQKQITF